MVVGCATDWGHPTSCTNKNGKLRETLQNSWPDACFGNILRPSLETNVDVLLTPTTCSERLSHLV